MIAAGVVVGRVVKVENHPNADWLRLAHVDLGDGGGPVQIVFGGPPVVEPEDLVAVAPSGARVAAAKYTKMRKRRYRGEISHGMLCSLDELGWAEGALDAVATLRNVRPGESLDNLSLQQRSSIVIGPKPLVREVAVRRVPVFANSGWWMRRCVRPSG